MASVFFSHSFLLKPFSRLFFFFLLLLFFTIVATVLKVFFMFICTVTEVPELDPVAYCEPTLSSARTCLFHCFAAGRTILSIRSRPNSHILQCTCPLVFIWRSMDPAAACPMSCSPQFPPEMACYVHGWTSRNIVTVAVRCIRWAA